MTLVDRIWHRCRLATLSWSRQGLGIVEDGLIAAREGRIVYAGRAADAPTGLEAKERIDCGERWITPGLIDCHTHLVYGGNRSGEFEQRLGGATYEEIARAGGGIISTVQATRRASVAELIAATRPRLGALVAEGVTTIEIKSGYGLSLDAERRQLRAARQLGEDSAVTVRTTFLGAHAIPPEMRGRDAVDAFCEKIAFSPDETARVFTAARTLGLPVRLHADQLSNLHGAELAAKFSALSADHLEYADHAGIAAMKAAGTVAVVLPGAFYFIREQQLPPIDAMRRHGVPIALATDSNPGTSPLTSILLAMNMGATLFRLTVNECIAAVTREAAQALGLWHEIGTLDAGKFCDLAIWNIDRPAELVYRMGFNPLHARVYRGI